MSAPSSDVISAFAETALRYARSNIVGITPYNDPTDELKTLYTVLVNGQFAPLPDTCTEVDHVWYMYVDYVSLRDENNNPYIKLFAQMKFRTPSGDTCTLERYYNCYKSSVSYCWVKEVASLIDGLRSLALSAYKVLRNMIYRTPNEMIGLIYPNAMKFPGFPCTDLVPSLARSAVYGKYSVVIEDTGADKIDLVVSTSFDISIYDKVYLYRFNCSLSDGSPCSPALVSTLCAYLYALSTKYTFDDFLNRGYLEYSSAIGGTFIMYNLGVQSVTTDVDLGCYKGTLTYDTIYYDFKLSYGALTTEGKLSFVIWMDLNDFFKTLAPCFPEFTPDKVSQGMGHLSGILFDSEMMLRNVYLPELNDVANKVYDLFKDAANSIVGQVSP